MDKKDFGQVNITNTVILAFLFVLIGTVLVLNNFGIVDYRIWDYVWKMWPVVFILFGILLMTKKK